jgi:hypothetical protein
LDRKISGALLALALLAGNALAQGTLSLESIKAIYEKTLQKIEQDAKDTLKGLPGQYERKLDELAAGLQKSGDLEGLLTLNKERTRFKAERTVPDASPADLPAAVVKLQDEHRKAKEQAERDKNEKSGGLAKQYLARLETLKKDLTTQGKIEQALAVKQEIARVELTEAFTVIARQPPAAEEPKPGAPDALERAKEQPEPASLRKGLILHYSFDKNDGDTVKDLSGQENHGRMERGRWTPEGISGGACDLDGRASIAVGPSKLQPSQPFTISAWAKPAATDSHMRIFDSANSGDGWDLGLDEAGTRFEFYWFAGRHVFLAADQKFKLGEWYHVVGTYDGRAGNLFVDGVLQRSKGSSPYNQERSVHWAVGAYGTGHGERATPDRWQGLLDEIRLYDRALSPTEIRALFLLHGAGKKAGASSAGR